MKNLWKLGTLAAIILVVSAVALPQFVTSTGSNREMSYRKAAQKNAVLKKNLSWKWGRPQRGWHLYIPLISKTLDTNANPDSTEFASSVADWQRARGIRADGVINQKTLFSFIEHWQAKRIRPIYEAKEDDLLTAPISDFYDPTREERLLKVDRSAYDAFKRMVADAGTHFDRDEGKAGIFGPYLSIVSSYRSPAYQRELRRKDPKANRAQLAVRSPHFTGRALDIYVGGEPVTSKDANRAIQVKTPAYLWMVENAEKYGFVPYFYEPWHWEYVE